MKKVINGVEFEMIEDAAPRQFSEPDDYMMIYRVLLDGEHVISTAEGLSLKQVIETCDGAAQFFKDVSTFLKGKKQVGNRCS